MICNINERFPSDVLEILDTFSVFNLEKVATDCSSNVFTVYCNSEVEILCGYYLGTDDEKRHEFMNESDSFKF